LFVSINNEIKSEIFENWLITKLLPQLPSKSIVVLDNAPTHSRQINKPPVQNSNKNSIKDWLKTNNINFNNNLNKQELLKLVKENTLNKNFKVDELIKSFGHIPLRLPPYNCQFNPIEYVWAQFKKDVSKHNFNDSLTQFKNLIPKSFEKVSESFCAKCIRHVNKIESD